MGYLSLRKRPGLISESVVRGFDLEKTRDNLKVCDVLSIIRENRFEDYDFTENKTGCRHWMSKLLQLLKTENVIGCFPNVEEALKWTWKTDGKPKQKLEMAKGTFHDG